MMRPMTTWQKAVAYGSLAAILLCTAWLMMAIYSMITGEA